MTRVAEDKRKKKRAPRGRSGCLTCRKKLTSSRERRVKCDEGKPVCRNCLKIDRTCKGYEAAHLPVKSITALRDRERQTSWTSTSGSSPDSSKPDIDSPRISVDSLLIGHTKQEYEQNDSPEYKQEFVMQKYGQNDPLKYEQEDIVQEYDQELVQVYDEEVTRDFDQEVMQDLIVHGSSSYEFAWRICQSPTVFDRETQRAINFFNERTIKQIGSWFSRPLWSQLPMIAYKEKTIEHAMIALASFHEQYTTSLVAQSALKHYTKAVQLLQHGIPKAESILCLMMFFAIELLHRSYSSAMQLLRVARRMMFDIRMETSELYLFLRNLIRRIDKQVTEICGSIDPELTYTDLWGVEPFMSRNLISKPHFQNHREAYDAILQVIERYYNDEKPHHQAYLDELATWEIRFEEFKRLDNLDELSISKIPGLEVYRRYYQILISKDRDSPIQQIWWDQHETILNETVDFLELDPDMNRGVSFGLEFCLIFQLFKIGRDCRSPIVRRRILTWLRSLKVQEGVLTGDLVCKVLNKVIRVEEDGYQITSSSQIPECRRIQEIELEFSDDLKKMKYRIDNEWKEEVLSGV